MVKLIYFLFIMTIILMLSEFYKSRSWSFGLNILLFYLIIELLSNQYSWHIVFFSNEIWKILIISLIFLSFIIILSLLKDYQFEIIVLNLMVLIGSVIIVTCDNLLIIYLGLELQTFSIFVLISKNRNSIKSSEAALKYFILGALSSGLFLLGVSLIFSSGLSLDLNNLVTLSAFNLDKLQISSFLISLAVFFKLAVFPLHFWIADIYEGSDWDVVSLISTIPKISVLSIILQILSYSNFFIISAIVSIIIGTLGAFNQTKFKRLLAYSGISHMGFIMLGIGLLNNQGLESSLIYLIIYIITIFGVFLILSISTSFSVNYYVVELGGLHLLNKVLSISWLILFLSIAGIPPLSGFISKWLILLTMLDYKYLFPIFISIIFSAISLGYYLRIIKVSYFQSNSSYLNWNNILCLKSNKIKINYYTLGFIVYFNLFLILHPSLVFSPFYLGVNYFF